MWKITRRNGIRVPGVHESEDDAQRVAMEILEQLPEWDILKLRLAGKRPTWANCGKAVFTVSHATGEWIAAKVDLPHDNWEEFAAMVCFTLKSKPEDVLSGYIDDDRGMFASASTGRLYPPSKVEKFLLVSHPD